MENKEFFKEIPSFLKFRDEVTNEVTVTKTEAEFIADQIAELNSVSTYSTNNSDIKLYTEYVSIFSEKGKGDKVQKGQKGMTVNELNSSIEELNKSCELTSFEAYLRESIKYLCSLTEDIDSYDLNHYKRDKNYMDDINMLIDFAKVPDINEDILYKKDLGFISDYFKYQTYASYYGSRVLHRSGSLSLARQDLNNKLNDGSYMDNVGDKVVMTEYEPSIDKKTLDDIFFKLQGVQRDYQSKYNGLKRTLDEIKNNMIKANNERNSDALMKNNQRNQEINAEFKVWKFDQSELIKKLKIIIPNDFINIYNEIKSKLN